MTHAIVSFRKEGEAYREVGMNTRRVLRGRNETKCIQLARTLTSPGEEFSAAVAFRLEFFHSSILGKSYKTVEFSKESDQ